MKTLTCLFSGLSLVVIGCAQDQSAEVAALKQEVTHLRSIAGPPPSALDSLYPPESHAPVFLMQMFGMAMPFMGITVDVSEGDMENAQADFERFSKAYDDAAQLVPEWSGLYPRKPVDELGAALGSGDRDRLMAAIDGVGNVCHNCHVDHLASVQQRYRWPAFSDLMVTDPVSGQEAPWPHFMRSVEFSLAGVEFDVDQGQFDAARGHFSDFNKKFQELREACEFCHSTERTYFVDAKIQGMIDELGSAVGAPTPDKERITGLIQGIGQESCGKCHLVHVPSSYSKTRWLQGGTPDHN